MVTYKDGLKKLLSFLNGFEKEGERIVVDHKDDLVEFVREQLYSGIDGTGQRLSLPYSQDPFFATSEAGRWKNDAKGYARWKAKIQPPKSSFLGYPPRNVDTPNLIIRGDFYDSLIATIVDGGVKIESRGVAFSREIESKYGLSIYAIAPKSKEYFARYIFKPEFEKYMSILK